MTKRSEDLRRRERRIQDFRDGLVSLLNCCQPDQTTYYLGQVPWIPRPGMEAEVARRKTELERLTAPAGIAMQECGIWVDFKPAGTMQTQPINPVLVWPTLLDRPLISADLIIGQCERAIGMFAAEAEDAEAHEGTTVGRIESTLDGPRGIWRVIRGAPSDARSHKTAAWTGALLAVVLAVIAGGILHFLGWA